MGFLSNRYIRSENKKFALGIFFDILLIVVFILVALNIKTEFERGFNAGMDFCQTICVTQIPVNETYIEKMNISINLTEREIMSALP